MIQLRPLAISIAFINAGVSSVALAQQVEEELVVTGIRSSLERSMDLKRDAQGVVDSISAEDIGKMPDTNLAESLQRITGVSIDRTNGEGSRVTVRGFGPQYNLVTLNGRQMPAANIADTSASNDRSFDFANLAAESVAGVDIYKTGKANFTTGGLGSTINIRTARPLDMPGLNASVGGKLVHDTSNRTGEDITPEVSGIYSQTFADDTFGIAVSGNYARRDFGVNTAGTSSGWYTIKGYDADWGSLPTDGSFDPRPEENDVYSVPRNIMYRIQDFERTRMNGLVTLQYAPTDDVTATLDYTYSELEVEQHRQELSAWFNGLPSYGEYTQGTNVEGSVVGPVIYADNTGVDVGMGVGDWGTKNENQSIAFNLEWRATDALTLALDYHDSSAEAGAVDDRGTNNIVTASQYDRASSVVDYSNDMPVLDIIYADGVTGLDASRMLSGGTSFRNSYQNTEIQQVRIDGRYEFDWAGLSSIDFGVGSTELNNQSAYSNAQRDTWGGYGTAAQYDDSIYTLKDLSNEFSDLGGSGNSMLEPYYAEVDFDGLIGAIGAIAQENGEEISPCGTRLCANMNSWDTDRRMEETQQSAYVQANFAWDGDMPMNLVLGVRYEETEVTSRALVPTYDGLAWTGDNEFSPIATGESDFTELSGDYTNVLPNVDFDITFFDSLKARASISKTIARPNYQDVQGGVTINTPVRFNGGTGGAGNPDLEPFESDNLDLSLEWYYAEGSYVSAGYYRKDVVNFIGQSTVEETVFDLAHPAQGPRYDDAVAANGGNTDPAVIRPYMEGEYGAPVVGDSALGDPSTVFTLIIPSNAEEAAIDGFEVALQHMFWDSGFGAIVNFTTVDGDIGYDNYNTNRTGENQFALLGLSDSYNVIGFYDKHGLEARIAYNWRDEFLTSTLDGDGQMNPIYTEAYGQWDVNVSYDFTDALSAFVEGINVTGENQRLHGRHPNMVIDAVQQGARYGVGVRYKF